MKKITIFLLGIMTAGLFAFTSATYLSNKSTAEVEQDSGVYVFYRSKPVTKYEYIGTYKIGLIWDDNPKLLFNKLIKKTKEKFPEADALIIDNDMVKCDAIKFK